MNCKLLSALILISILGGCSSLPFVGGDDDEDIPVTKKKEKVKTALVFTSKGEQQCEDDTGDSTKATKARLVSNGIEVFSSECAKITGMMHPSLCGSITLDINVHSINEDLIPQAQKLGFETIESLEDRDLDYKTYPCDL
ncbi:MAG: hypothetical protein ACU84Q_21880 [Gammaproteobacteria bacterium]